MASHPVAAPRRHPAVSDGDDRGTLVPQRNGGFVTFRYTATEIVASGSRARVRARHARFDGERLTTEAFDGEVDGAVLDRLQADARRLFEAQLALWWKSFAPWLPSARRGPDEHG